jgi:uncharacterized protein YbaP (TraB family)
VLRLLTLLWFAPGLGIGTAHALDTAASAGALPASAPAADTAPFEHGLLWRVDRPGVPAPSHLFATVHIDDPRATDFSPAVIAALAGAKTFLPELVPDAASAEAFGRATQLPATQRLPDLLGTERFARVAETLGSRYGVPPERVARLKPWAAYVFLSQPARPMGEIVDAALIRLADVRGIAIRPLESVETQIAAMDAVPMASQLALLNALALDHDSALADIDRLVELYLARDLAGIRKLQDASISDDPALRGPMADFTEQILYRRNAAMVEALLPQLEAGGAFAAMGALHLEGDQGLLARLSRLGWRVQRVE